MVLEGQSNVCGATTASKIYRTSDVKTGIELLYQMNSRPPVINCAAAYWGVLPAQLFYARPKQR
jgi:hypothetical protein